ncbi:hypothetical protein NKH61_09505 [Mesorhizobium sp. M1005]|uniref:hypothetical protein n=1 Tax=unclassified Mesorhizobium TaxID=325217 RepID=UPI0033356778
MSAVEYRGEAAGLLSAHFDQNATLEYLLGNDRSWRILLKKSGAPEGIPLK